MSRWPRAKKGVVVVVVLVGQSHKEGVGECGIRSVPYRTLALPFGTQVRPCHCPCALARLHPVTRPVQKVRGKGEGSVVRWVCTRRTVRELEHDSSDFRNSKKPNAISPTRTVDRPPPLLQHDVIAILGISGFHPPFKGGEQLGCAGCCARPIRFLWYSQTPTMTTLSP
jgi:hypothetical protein